MLGVNQSDFMSYMSALKTNYRKGIHRMEAILANPTHASEFAANLGGVSVVLGVPVGLPDRNSDKLLELLLGSDVADDAVLTWMHQFYEFTDWDDLMGNAERCKEMANNPLIWRAAGGSKLAVGKSIATLAGLSCSAYKDIDAVVASSTARTAIEKSQTAKNAIAASDMATAKYAVGAAGLNPADYANMAAVASSQTAMAAIVASQTARKAIESSNTAISALSASSRVVTGYATIGTAYNKDCWIVSACCTTSNSSSYQYTIGNFYDSPTTKTGMYGNAHKAVSRFAKNAAVTADTAGGWQHEIKYIPC